MYDKILIPLDGSAAAEIVLPYVEEIAARSGAEIHLVSVLAEMDSSTDAALREYLDGLSARLEAEIDSFDPKEETSLRQTVLTGKPATEIIQYADINEISLIAITASGKSGDGPWLLGNISSKILRGITRPVLLVRAPAAEEPIAKRSLIKKVLVPLDGSELGESAIPQVEALAKALDFDIVLLHVMEPVITAAMPGLASVTIPSAKEEAKRETESLEYLEEMEAKLRSSGLNTSSELRSGSAAEEIITYAEENNIDLIAMSTHGRSGIGRWVFGSVTDKVLHAGDVPVLTVRASKSPM